MNKKLPLLLGLMLLSLPSIAKEDNPLELTVFGGYRFGGNLESVNNKQTTNISMDEGISYGLLLAWDYDRKRQTELLFSHYNFTLSETNGIYPIDDNNDVKDGGSVSYLHFGGNVPISQSRNPVRVSGGIGLTHMAPEEDQFRNETRLSINLGLNTPFAITDNVKFRIGSRLYATFFNTDSKVFCDTDNCGLYVSGNVLLQAEVNAGLTFAF